MDTRVIRAVGAFLTEYENNLRYCEEFRRAVEGEYTLDGYLPLWERFITEWRVVRNVPIDCRREALQECIRTAQSSPLDVDGLSWRLRDIAGSRLLSLASKSLMLYSPHRIPPLDSFACRMLGVPTTSYKMFLKAWQASYTSHREDVILPAMKVIRPLAEIVEARFPDTPEPRTVRLMRMFDMYLWQGGRI